MNWVSRKSRQHPRKLEINPSLFTSRKLSSSPPPQSHSSKISPAVLFVIVALAVIVFVSGLLHLLIKHLLKRRRSSSLYSSSSPPRPNLGSSSSRRHRHHHHHHASDALQRQLQQLFHLHDSGLDQAAIDALPVFLYEELVGPKEPFDCAVCLCEFAPDNRLRLLPGCSHAFHVDCIDTWLLSSSTCPLCRGALLVPTAEDPVYDVAEAVEDGNGSPVDREDGPLQKPSDLDEGSTTEEEAEEEDDKLVLPVRLGKFRSVVAAGTSNVGVGQLGVVDSSGGAAVKECGGSSSSSVGNSSSRRSDMVINGGGGMMVMDGRRCYSMGTYQYVEGDSVLHVALTRNWEGKRKDTGGAVKVNGAGGDSSGGGVDEIRLPGKRLFLGSKGESFSVSKIWQWRSKKWEGPF